MAGFLHRAAKPQTRSRRISSSGGGLTLFCSLEPPLDDRLAAYWAKHRFEWTGSPGLLRWQLSKANLIAQLWQAALALRLQADRESYST
jgi:hypothetical protein